MLRKHRVRQGSPSIQHSRAVPVFACDGFSRRCRRAWHGPLECSSLDGMVVMGVCKTDPIVQFSIEIGRLISVDDEVMISELRTRWHEARDQLRNIRQSGKYDMPEFNAKLTRVEILRRAYHRLQELAELDHIQRFGEAAK